MSTADKNVHVYLGSFGCPRLMDVFIALTGHQCSTAPVWCSLLAFKERLLLSQTSVFKHLYLTEAAHLDALDKHTADQYV